MAAVGFSVLAQFEQGTWLQATSKVGAGLLDRVTGIAHSPEQSMLELNALNRPWSEMTCMRIRLVSHYIITSYDSGNIHWPI
jgi:hypothetical protein